MTRRKPAAVTILEQRDVEVVDLVPLGQERAQEPTAEVAPLDAVAAPPAPAAAPQPESKPAPRRVSAEALKAETRLQNMERAAAASLAACEQRWADKRRQYIRGLPFDVQNMLCAGGVIDDDDMAAAGRAAE